jgi:hypothetical protein
MRTDACNRRSVDVSVGCVRSRRYFGRCCGGWQGSGLCELLAISFIRYRYMGGKLANAIVQVVIGSGIEFAIGAWFGGSV